MIAPLVRISTVARSPLEGLFLGALAAESENFVLLSKLSSLRFDGFVLLPRARIFQMESVSNDRLVGALLKVGTVLPRHIDLPLGSFRAFFEWIRARGVVCGLHFDDEDGEYAAMGVVSRAHSDLVALREISPKGEVDDVVTTHRYADVKIVSFLGAYEVSLQILSGS